MEGQNAEEKLFQLWMIYSAKHDVKILEEFVNLFVEHYKDYIDCDFNHLNDGFSEEGPHLTRLPDGILEALGTQLTRCAGLVTGSRERGGGEDEDTTQVLAFAQRIVQCLIIICRNNDNVHLVASCEFVSHTIMLSTVCIEQICLPLKEQRASDVERHLSFIKHSLHFLECLYDPYFVWRKRLRGWNIDKARQTCQPALLHNEVVPFFHECFQKTGLSSDIQVRLLHMFGAIMCGSQSNSLKGITPATLDVMLKVLSAHTVQGPTNAQRQEAATLKDLVLHCIVRMVHVIHECSPDQRQIEVSEVMQGYMQVLLNLDMEPSAEVDCKMQLTMINMINEMIACNDKSALQVLMVSGGTFDGFVSLLLKTTLTGADAQKLAMAVVRVMQAILSGSPNAKTLFEGRVGYQRFVEALKSLGQPSMELLQTLLDLVVEEQYESSNKMHVVNTQAAMMLLQWLPDIQSRELQVWLAEQLTRLCSHGHRSRMSCCTAGMITHIITVLGRQKQIDHKAVGHLIGLLEILGTLSITAGELKQLISLFRVDEEGKQMPYTTRLMRAIATMARREGKETALNFFDLQKPHDCISLPALRKWPGPAFSFHAWICLDTEIDLRKHMLMGHQTFRRQLYIFNDGSNNGLEAFVTPAYDLVVAVYNKKEFCTFTVTDTRLQDGLWHSVGVVHTAARRPFSQSQVLIYIDGRQKSAAPFRFPNLTEPFSTCRIGSPGPHYTTEVHHDNSVKVDHKKPSVFPLKALFGGVAKSATPPPAVGVTILPAGSQDEYWGPPITIHGRLSTVSVFSDLVHSAQFRALNMSGPNDITVFKDDADLVDLPAKLVARYSAKACKDHVCADLSPYQNHGQFCGEKCVAWDIKDTINCVGGVQVLFPLLEQVDPDAPVPTPAETPVAANGVLTSSSHSDSGEDWVVLGSSSYADSKLEQNQVAAFLTLLRHMLQTKPVNQDTFVRTQGAATVGALLQKVSPQLIDVNVLMAVQLLVEASVAANKTLTNHLHQYILFDFRVWSKSAFPVRIGHIQYLSTIIKDDRKLFRKKYGVQYILDIIRAYYTSSDESSLTEEDSKTIRVSLFNLIKYYIIRDIKANELSQIIGFLVVVKQQELILECLDLLLSLLESHGRKYDQLYILLFEPEQAEMLYKLLTYKNYPIIFYEKVVKMLWVLLKSDRVYDKNKHRLRLGDMGHWGLVSMMSGYTISVPMIKRFIEQVSYVDTGQSYNSILAVLSLIHNCGLDIKLEASRQDRGQVFVCLDKVSLTYNLVHPRLVLKRRLLEMMLQSCSEDIRGSDHISYFPSAFAQPLANHTENAIELVRMVWGFITKEADECGYAFSETLLDEVMALLDVLSVWDTEAGHGWTEMVHLGFHILLTFASRTELELCSAATVKLTTLVQTKLISSSAEASFILGFLHDLIVKAVEEDSVNYAYLMNVLKAMISKAHTLLTIDHLLPHLPQTAMSPTFFDDFRTYCNTEEWLNFMQNYIKPQHKHFMENHFGETSTNLNTFWMECQEAVEVTYHKHNREIGDSKLKLQSQIFDACSGRVSAESRRFQNLLTQQKNQHLSTLRQWRAMKKFFTSERGAWREHHQELLHWKLSNQENFSRMKVKMIPNYTFDPHLDACQQRDNMGGPSEEDEVAAEKILVSKEALVSKENIADDTLGDEEWSVISASSANVEEYTGKEKLVISEDVELVTLVDVIKGRLEVTTTHVYFFDCSSNKEEGGEDFKWSLTQLREIHFRRYNLRRSALEIFLVDQTNYFINFPRKRMRNKVYSRILSLRPPNLSYYGTRSPAELLKASNLTQKWVQREISNFDYLMQLNTIAGRTYNDLSQYPVFPWILSDYVSEELDLDNPGVFRDLSKPVGIVNPKNESEVRDKYDTFEDPSGTIEKFHYGTHYSNAAGVMHYMVRLEPFTTLHIQLQSGKFDVADRQFHSVPGSWHSLMDNPNDVKELIPEFFYLPEFLINQDGFNLGRLQITQDPVNDVILPPWAKTPEEFIQRHREALESEYVSNNLNHWIDLIFGYKQKGPAAVEALNVFYYVTYEGAVDLDAIQDPRERASLEGMINNFGQTPTQLLKEPHPKRMSFDEAVAKANKTGRPMSIFYFLSNLKPYFVEVSSETDPLVFVHVPRSQPRSILQKGMPDNMITVTEDGIIGIHGWLPFDKNINYYYTFEKDATMLNAKTKRRIGGPFTPGLKMESKLFAVTHDARLLLSGGYWDNSLQVYRLDKTMTVNHIIRHIDIITCLSLDHCGRHLITGSRDTTCMVWEIQQQGGLSVNIDTRSVITLYGHDEEVTAVHMSTELDLAVSASKDGTVILHTVRRGHYMRTVRPSCDPSCRLDIPLLVVSDMGQIVLYCTEINALGKTEKHMLHQYSVNSKFLCSRRVVSGVSQMVIAGDHMVMGDLDGQLTVFQLFGLKPLSALQLLVQIQCLTLTNGNSHILVGLRDGKLIIVGVKGKPDGR